MGENDKEVVEEKSEEQSGERNAVTRNYPASKYELAIVAAKEARRLNENWKDTENSQGVRVTEKALDRVRKGEVHYSIQDNEGS